MKLRDFIKGIKGKPQKEADMEFKDNIGIKGKFHAKLWDKDGNLLDERIVENTVTELGDAYVADCVSDRGEIQMSHMAVGTGTPTATALGTELDRNALTSTTQGTGADDNDVIFIGDWAAGDGTGAITEAGIFNAATAGTMFLSSSFSVINKGASDIMKITLTCTLGSS